MNALITICARGGSKGIPGKNIKLLNGKPLIVYTIESAKKFQALHGADIVVSTDDDDIKEVILNLGVQVYDRPDYLATDSAGKVETITDVLAFQENKNGKKYDYILDLDVTSPLRTLEDLSQGFTIIKNDAEAYNIYSVNPANRNPYFNMVERKDNGYYHLVKEGSFLSRQAAPPVYDMNASFYFFKRSFFTSGQKTSTTTNSLIYVMPHVCFDLDHIIDFEFLEFLMSTNKLGFNL